MNIIESHTSGQPFAGYPNQLLLGPTAPQSQCNYVSMPVSRLFLPSEGQISNQE